MKIRIISWNIDCIGARFEAFKRMMAEYKPDIVCLQKFKSSKAPENFMIPGYSIAVSPIAHGGVATYVREGIEVLSQFVPTEGPFKGHLLKTELANPHVTLFNTYVPYANKSIEGFEERRRIFDDLLLKEIEATKTPILMCGDMNIVHTQYDVWDGRYKSNAANYRDWERENFEKRLKVGNLIDTFHTLHPDETVLTYFGFKFKQGREQKMGVRLDYFLAGESLRPMITKADVLHEVVDAPSTPIILELDCPDKRKAVAVFDFFEMGLKVGDFLTYTLKPGITVSIATNRKVLYKGNEVYLTPLTNELRGKKGHMGKYWTINDNTIDDLYYAAYYHKKQLSPEAKLVADFIKERLDGDINRLAEFNLAELKGDKRYGCPSRPFDCDDTNLMRSIYCLVFGDVFPAMNSATLKDYTFRGDTINTYNSMFGKPSEKSTHPGLDHYEPSPELSEKVKAFNIKFQTIGNMMPLPCLLIGRQSINTYRGTHRDWKDFIDRFLAALRPILIGDNNGIDKGLAELVSVNMAYLKTYASENGYYQLMKGLILEDYLDAGGKPFIQSKGFYFWKKGIDRNAYLAEAERYIDFSKQVIDHRAARIIKILKSQLKI